MQKLLKLIVFIVIVGTATANLVVIDSGTLFERDVNAQNMTNANTSNLTGVENHSSSANITARLNISSPEPEPKDYPTANPN
jgi:hypothetical protein